MTGSGPFTLSVLFSIVAGTAAGILSLLTLEILRRSPFGQAVLVLSLSMAAFVVYHATLLVSPGLPVVASVIRSAMYTGVAAFVWLAVWQQYRMRSRAGEVGGEVNS